MSIPGQLPRNGGNDIWIVSGSVTLDDLGNYQFVQRDSINCVTCSGAPDAYTIETLVSSGSYRIADTVVTFSGLSGSSTVRGGVIRIPGLAYGTDEFAKR